MILNEIQIMNDIIDNDESFGMLYSDWKFNIEISRPKLLGDIGNFRLAETNMGFNLKERLIAAYDSQKNKFAAFMHLDHFNGAAKNVFVVSIVAANKEYRGINLPTQMYSYLIQEEGLILVSDEIQTLGGRSVWEKLAKIKGIGIYGYNTNTKKVFSVDMDDIFNEDIYDDGLNDEIETLESEANQLAIINNSDKSRINQIKKELKHLYDARLDTNHHMRLFAGRVR